MTYRSAPAEHDCFAGGCRPLCVSRSGGSSAVVLYTPARAASPELPVWSRWSWATTCAGLFRYGLIVLIGSVIAEE